MQFGDLVMFAAPSRSAVAAALWSWGLGVEGECQVATKGVENTNIFFTTRARRWVLRLHRTAPIGAVHREAEILRRLAPSGLPVPCVVRDIRGKWVGRAWGHPATVHSFLEGVDLEHQDPSLDTAHAIGDLVGRVDRALARIDVGPSRATPAHELTNLGETRRRLTQILDDGRAGDPATCAGVAVPWDRVAAALAELEAAPLQELWRSLPRQLIHGDVSAQNVLRARASDRLAGLIDFGDATTSARVAEIAIAIAQFGFSKGRARPKVADALWEGWSKIVSPARVERLALPSLLASRFVKLVIDHVWRGRYELPHPGHRALVVAGVEGLHALRASTAVGLPTRSSRDGTGVWR